MKAIANGILCCVCVYVVLSPHDIFYQFEFGSAALSLCCPIRLEPHPLSLYLCIFEQTQHNVNSVYFIVGKHLYGGLSNY